jgi:hypothetical protein
MVGLYKQGDKVYLQAKYANRPIERQAWTVISRIFKPSIGEPFIYYWLRLPNGEHMLAPYHVLR